MFFHVIMTTECNLQCRYCFSEALDDTNSDFSNIEVEYSLPKKISYDIHLLKKFCKQDPNCVVTFYGGEPLLSIDEMKHIMDNVRVKHFMMQTNGLLLDRLPSEYVNRFHTILVSVDGEEALTDYYRGLGVFRKVISNLRLILRNGFKGELIARMTVMEKTDIYNQVLWLLNNNEFPFPSVHWQLNAGFWRNDFARRNFKQWVKGNYDPGIRRLARFWVDQMQDGMVLRLYPFLGIVQSLFSGEKKSLLRCGGGWINYAIQTDGYIVPCPTMWGMKNYYLGHISNENPQNIRKIFVSGSCLKCDILDICGGRCLYANVTRRWNSEAYGLVCSTVRNLINAVSQELPKIRKLVSEGKIGLGNFDFVRYNGCEIIP